MGELDSRAATRAIGRGERGEGNTLGGAEGEQVCEPTRFGAPQLMAGGEAEDVVERPAALW
ncbi:hypothetical protein [Streptomyces sp. NPDC001880]